ncbi:YdeI/OmpD-associated family protein [Chitinimonas koreensis]|uniref:YdeI/OmpD-associated family protein n=1 Tax=Chitinimonas koreensis TaxID=356302 RepID=UPI000425E866|nr:YdeI/OmpD-associated family protein [Chitinimonas koreensis]QNM98007.1 YdeI/OmpD-associated family protein [Chitinimonas koreensis]
MNAKVDAFLSKAEKWQDEFGKLRAILLDGPLAEELKWGVPCYAFEGRNVVLMHGFKEYCALLFFKGALLKDPEGILVVQSEHTQATRQIRFTDGAGIDAMASVLKAYVREAIEVEKAGLKVALKKTGEFEMPAEFREKLDALPELKTAFEALTPGRQRAYLLHFSGAKQSKTRTSRVEKCVPRILDGKGLDDE